MFEQEDLEHGNDNREESTAIQTISEMAWSKEIRTVIPSNLDRNGTQLDLVFSDPFKSASAIQPQLAECKIANGAASDTPTVSPQRLALENPMAARQQDGATGDTPQELQNPIVGQQDRAAGAAPQELQNPIAGQAARAAGAAPQELQNPIVRQQDSAARPELQNMIYRPVPPQVVRDARGRLESEVTFHPSNGSVQSRTEYRDGVRSVETNYNHDGRPSSVTQFDHAGRPTHQVEYNPDGSRSVERKFHGNQRTSEEILYDNGRVREHRTFGVSGELDHVDSAYGEHGPERRTHYREGRVSSVVSTQYENGVPARETERNAAGARTAETILDKVTGLPGVRDNFNPQTGRRTNTVQFDETGRNPAVETMYAADGNTRTSEIRHDGNTRTETRFRPDGSPSSETSFWGNGLRRSHTTMDEQGQRTATTKFYPDGQTRMTEIKHANGRPVTAEHYDLNGRQTAVERYEYGPRPGDALRYRETHNRQTGETEWRNPNGELVRTRDRVGNEVVYRRDANGFVTPTPDHPIGRNQWGEWPGVHFEAGDPPVRNERGEQLHQVARDLLQRYSDGRGNVDAPSHAALMRELASNPELTERERFYAYSRVLQHYFDGRVGGINQPDPNARTEFRFVNEGLAVPNAIRGEAGLPAGPDVRHILIHPSSDGAHGALVYPNGRPGLGYLGQQGRVGAFIHETMVIGAGAVQGQPPDRTASIAQTRVQLIALEQMVESGRFRDYATGWQGFADNNHPNPSYLRRR